MNNRVRSLVWRYTPRAALLARYVRHFQGLPRVRHPRTFNEKVLVKMLFDRDPKLVLFTDKYAVRAYVADKLGGKQNLTALYAAVDRPDEIGTLNLPNRFIMKPNHLCRQIRVVKDLAAIERKELVEIAASWLGQNWGHEHGEWAYRDIPPRVLFEELLEENGHGPTDYRIHCFSGEPLFLLVTRDIRGPNPTNTFYDVDFRVLPVRLVRTNSRYVAAESQPPPNFSGMLEIARKLSAGTDFLRVDLYNIAGRIVFGELTSYPSAGLGKFEPPSWDLTFGGYWRRAGGATTSAG